MIETFKRVLGEEHPDTLTSMNNFAFMFGAQGCKDEAILLMEKYFQLRKKVLGAHHSYTTSSPATLNGWQVREHLKRFYFVYCTLVIVLGVAWKII